MKILLCVFITGLSTVVELRSAFVAGAGAS